MSNEEIFLRINNSTNAVDVITSLNGIKTEMPVSLEDVVASLNEAVKKEKKTQKFSPVFGILNEEEKGFSLIQTIQTGKKSFLYIIKRRAMSAPMQLFERMYNNVGMPTLLFAISVVNNKASKIYVVPIKDTYVTKNTQLFKYPFSNVFGNGSVCIGSNYIGIEKIQTTKQLYKVVHMFFSMPNNMDAFSPKNNTRGYEYDQLLKELQNKDFDNSLLVKNKEAATYQQWINNIIK